MAKKKKMKVMTIDALTAFKVSKPHYVPKFRTGGHLTEKDRPRKKDWLKTYKGE